MKPHLKVSCSVTSSRSCNVEHPVAHLPGFTTSPNGQWATRIVPDLVWEVQETKRGMRFLIRDSDDKLIVANEVLRSEGTETLRNPVRAPRANVFAVGWIGTMRAECLDELLNFSHRQLNHVLRTYVEHCDTVRPHRGIGPLCSAWMPHRVEAGFYAKRNDRLAALVEDFRLWAPST